MQLAALLATLATLASMPALADVECAGTSVRAGHPVSAEAQVRGLLTGEAFPDAAKRALLENRLARCDFQSAANLPKVS